MAITIREAMAVLSVMVEVKRRLGQNYEAEAIGLGLKALGRIKQEREKTPDTTLTSLLEGESQ